MDESWQREFRERVSGFQDRTGSLSSIPVSIKVRVTSGCFHREHSPNAYGIIDQHLKTYPLDPVNEEYLEHENGPEIIAYLALGVAGLGVAKSVIELVTAIIRARSEGVKKGDQPKDALELIVRGYRNDDAYFQETVLRVDSDAEIDSEAVLKALDRAFKTLPKPTRVQNKKKG